MNLKTTLLLIILLAGAGWGGYYWHFQRTPPAVESPSAQFFDNDLKADALTRIEVRRGPRSFVLERSSPAAKWNLPGKFPARDLEVEQLVGVIAGMRSRFAPYDLEEKKTVLVKDPLTLKITLNGAEHVLTLAEETDEANHIARPTFVRLDDQPEVLRLAPGLVALLDHDEEYFRRHRIFLKERVARENSAERVNQVAAQSILITRAKTPAVDSPFKKFDKQAGDDVDSPRYRLVKAGKSDDTWEMAEPVRDRLEPQKLKALLAGLSGVWAEEFIDSQGRSLDQFGLDNPYLTIAVTEPGGEPRELQLGDIIKSKSETRKELKPGPPGPFGQPGEPRFEEVKVEFRYAKLASNPLIFEVKTDTLDDQLPRDARQLRDPMLAHFKTDEAQRLEVQYKGKPLVALLRSGAKGKESWKLEGGGYDAEESTVGELLSKLADLQTRAFIDKGDLKTYGLDHPVAVVKLTVKEKEKDDKDAAIMAGKDAKESKDAKPAREVIHVFHFGVAEKSGAEKPAIEKNPFEKTPFEKDKAKVYIQVPGWPRINVLDDAVLKLVERPAIAYRNRKLLDVPVAELETIQVRRAGDAFSFEHTGKAWKLKTPVPADVDSAKVGELAESLAKLDAVEFVADQPKADDLDKVYGLTSAALMATLHFKDATIKSLYVGNPHGKDGYYARIDQGPIFVVRKELHDTLGKDSLAYRAEKPWELEAKAITEFAVAKNDQEFRLQRAGDGWKVVAPFTADAVGFYGDKMAQELSSLKAMSYVTHQAKDQAKFGLDKPYLKIKVRTKSGEQTLLISKQAGAGHYACTAGSEGIFTLAGNVVAEFDVSVYDLLDREVLTIEPGQIVTCRAKGKTAFALEHKKDGWFVSTSYVPAFRADEDAAQLYLKTWANVRADKIVAYGPKIDWAAYGLDKPGAVYSVVLKGEGKDGKPVEHAVYLGKELPAPNERGDVYARIDQKPEVIVLNGFLVKMLAKSHLDFVNPLVLKFALDSVVSLSRQMPGGDFEAVKKGDAWQLLKPERPADVPTIETVLDATYRLRGQSVAAYPVQEANLAAFGLDKPTATVSIKLADAAGKTSEHFIRIGKAATDGSSATPSRKKGHYALVDRGDTVIVLAPELSRLLLASALNFGDRNLVSTFGVDQVILQRGTRKAVFLQESGTWTMVDPIHSEAESDELANLVRGLSRLRADEMIAEKVDLKTYGLDRPRIECKLFAGGKIVVDLAVGSAEPGDEKNPRLYAKLAGKDVVFLLSPSISAKIQEEFRSRKPWQPFDAAQVERISFEGPGRTFTLFKQGPSWLVSDKFGLKVDAKAVIDTLDALARLKALRYVEDAKANLQLYGLTPPALKVEVDSPSGKRTLLIGATEGMSFRRYANVSGSDSVFVIDVADLRRIMRDLAAFTGTRAKVIQARMRGTPSMRG